MATKINKANLVKSLTAQKNKLIEWSTAVKKRLEEVQVNGDVSRKMFVLMKRQVIQAEKLIETIQNRIESV